MSSSDKNLSMFEGSEIPSAKGYKIAIVYSEWNNEITTELTLGAKQLLLKQGINASDLIIHTVPGSFELTLGSQFMLSSDTSVDAVIALGVVIQGETKHFDFICQAVAQG
ncbi:MAG: 6,7-dimethyl-8-ribityllumazine synthase, partial [Bacteroidia bacterium]